MKKKTLKKVFSGAAIFLAAANMNGCAYGPGPSRDVTPIITRSAEEQVLPQEFNESETTYFPKESEDTAPEDTKEETSEGTSDVLES